MNNRVYKVEKSFRIQLC